jgi:hypothetical protein
VEQGQTRASISKGTGKIAQRKKKGQITIVIENKGKNAKTPKNYEGCQGDQSSKERTRGGEGTDEGLLHLLDHETKSTVSRDASFHH